jgi:predicted transposase YbfD/YdcC
MGLLAANTKEFIACFKELDDPRQDEKLLYPLDEVLFLTIASVLCCAESWRQIYDYGVEKLEFLRNYFPYEHGIPKKSTICTVMGLICKSKFEAWFTKWAQNLIHILPEDLINIDGKTIKGSKTKENKATHILNAFAKKQGIVIAQKTVGEKTNEIPEVPELLDSLQIEGATVTIDALNCQKKTVSKIIAKKANYFIGLKGNQPSLFEDAKYLFVDKNQTNEYFNYYSERNKGHGRIEWRKCWCTEIPSWFKEQHSGWEKLKSIYLVESERHIAGKRSIEQRLYISNTNANAKQGLSYSRGHWSVENQVHYILDVTFKEDNCQIYNAAENMSVIRKIILNVIKKYKSETKNKSSVPAIRKKASWSNNVTENVLSYLFM